ncbi:uncharacterized protein LOC131681634 [Topomyia yanbarensis]|uniref:uncharacterized protein LOC131681634 n=1 Tax=Topomyia yanbarensis TaxID=2498891 RepID=UPI00273ABC4A|nr:uncharacterized protein LOC131681634 [Topomyia yanbarensis]
MESFEENLLLVAASILTIGLLLKKKRNTRKNKRSCWVNPYLWQRNLKGRFAEDFDDLRAWKSEFAQNFHMEEKQFQELFQRVKHRLEPKRCTRPDGISAKQRFAYTLEYLAGGPFFERYAASNYRFSKATSCIIIKDTCQIIYEELAKTEFMSYTKENWLTVADGFRNKWNMPNCLGSLDGKHVRIKCPANAGSLYYNYKRYHSIILMAASDANYRFTFIDVGSPGADGDVNVFSRTEFGKQILEDTSFLDLPQDAPINGADLSYFFIADDAFPLSHRIMKPYGTANALTNDQRIFNYRLSRARRTVENAFGIMTMRWGCLRSEFLCAPDKVKVIVAACCALHNFLLSRDAAYGRTADRYDKDGQLIEGEWRMLQQFDQIDGQRRGRPNESGSFIRRKLTEYFNNIDILPFQYTRANCI